MPRRALIALSGVLGLFMQHAMAQEKIVNKITINKITIGQNGKTDYVIYYDPAASDSLQTAATELKSYFQKSAGFAPQIVAQAPAPAGPFISLGSTQAARTAGLDAAKIPADGFRITTRGRNLFILGQDTPKGEVTALGGTSNGTANGIYTFCEEYIGVRFLLPGDLGEEVPARAGIEVPANLDRTEVSPFYYRTLPYIGVGSKVEAWKRRNKIGQVAKVQHSHAWAETVPTSLFDQHPDWFAEIGGKRLPPTGRFKLETTNPELVQYFADRIIATFRKEPDRKWYSLSPSDGGGWSESAASKALYDTDPNGKPTITPLVLKFYNDVAKIVGKEFPDRKLGGYIYADYLYPPSSGIPKMEPNLALMVAASVSYGYRLYRPDVQKEWEGIIRAWGEAAQQSGADLYYYDLPTYFKQSMGVITPPAPEILNFIFSRLAKYGYDGACVYGVEGWPQSGPTNYAITKLMWNPNQDARELCREYYRFMYGEAAAPQIEKLYDVLDASFKQYYNKHPLASYNLTPEFHTEIYGPNYAEIESLFLKARDAATQPKQQSRLRLFGQILSLLQFNLKTNGALPADYQSQLTLSDEKIDELFSKPNKDFSITPGATEMKPESAKWRAEIAAPLADAGAAVIVPTRSDVRLLLVPARDGEVSISSKVLDARGEMVRYTLFDAATNEVLAAGALRAGRAVRFNGKAGQTYRLDVANWAASLQLEVQGAAIAYKTNVLGRGFRIEAYQLSGDLPLYFGVPEGLKSFNLIINGAGVWADVLAPDGKAAGTIDTRTTAVARLVADNSANRSGYWKILLHKPSHGEKIVYLVLDEKLPQWVFPDGAQTLNISTLP